MKELKRATFGLSILIALLCSGCSKYSNEQLVKDAKYCTDNGFDYEVHVTEWKQPTGVSCKNRGQ